MTDIKIRPAKLGDQRAFAEIHVAAWRAAYSGFMSASFLRSLDIQEREDMWLKALNDKGPGLNVVAELDRTVQGFCVYGPARDSDLDNTACELVALNVNPKSWGMGVGTSLLSYVIEESKRKSYRTLHLWVIDGNTRAISLYENSGFVASDKTKNDNTHSGDPISERRYSTELV